RKVPTAAPAPACLPHDGARLEIWVDATYDTNRDAAKPAKPGPMNSTRSIVSGGLCLGAGEPSRSRRRFEPLYLRCSLRDMRSLPAGRDRRERAVKGQRNPATGKSTRWQIPGLG